MAADRIERHFAEQERQVRAEMSQVRAKTGPDHFRRLSAAVMYRDGATTRYDALLKQYRAIEGKLSEPTPPPSFMGRVLGRTVPQPDRSSLERDHVAIRHELSCAERAMTSAMASVKKIERDTAAASMKHVEGVEGLTKDTTRRLDEIARARRLVVAFPGTVYSGPSFALWAGGKIERGRNKRGLRNPWARDMWGLPLDPGY